MSALSALSVSAAPKADGFVARLGSLTAAIAGITGAWSRQARIRRDLGRLAQLDDHLLSDLGLHRGDIIRHAGNDDRPLNISGAPF